MVKSLGHGAQCNGKTFPSRIGLDSKCQNSIILLYKAWIINSAPLITMIEHMWISSGFFVGKLYFLGKDKHKLEVPII